MADQNNFPPKVFRQFGVGCSGQSSDFFDGLGAVPMIPVNVVGKHCAADIDEFPLAAQLDQFPDGIVGVGRRGKVSHDNAFYRLFHFVKHKNSSFGDQKTLLLKMKIEDGKAVFYRVCFGRCNCGAVARAAPDVQLRNRNIPVGEQSNAYEKREAEL